MTSTRAINAAAGVIHAALAQGKTIPASIAYALDAAGLLNSPEHAAEVEQLRNDLTGACLARWEEEQDSARLRLAWRSARERAAAYGEGILRTVEDRESYQGWLKEAEAEVQRLRARVAELEAEAYGDAEVRLLTPIEQIRHLHACVAAQLARADTLDRLLREYQAAAGDGATRSVDEDPIAYSLTVEALHASSGAVIETPSRREQSTAKLRDLLARQQQAAAVEEPHDSPLHHDYRTPRDLPKVTP